MSSKRSAIFRIVLARKTTVRLLNVPQQAVSDAICRFKELGNDGRLPGSGRKNTSKNHKVIEKRVQRNPRISMRQITRDMGISDRSAAGQHWERFLFTDEKLLTVQQVHDSQNDRIWCVDAPSISTIVEHFHYPKSVMIWGGICVSGKTPLDFGEDGVKINKKMYRRDIIEDIVQPWAPKAFRKFRLDASTRLCTSLQSQKGTRVVQGEFFRHDII
ncbi:uncharacterized protein TNCV_4000831 [Trichonephila clavipes]|nr:uncharacterized protein TNCV_4000831 [Trichonephila clavipes]